MKAVTGIETTKELLKDYQKKQWEVEIKTVSGHRYQGEVDKVAGDYFSVSGYRDTYISIDKVESITITKKR